MEGLEDFVKRQLTSSLDSRSHVMRKEFPLGDLERISISTQTQTNQKVPSSRGVASRVSEVSLNLGFMLEQL